jgi:hypothetical protein
VNHLSDPQLGWPQSAEQSGLGSQRMGLTRFGVLHLIKQHGHHQHWVDPMAPAFAQHDRAQILETGECDGPQGFELIQPGGEQLGQPRLRSVDTKAAMQCPQFSRAELKRVSRLAAFGTADAADQTWVGEQGRLLKVLKALMDHQEPEGGQQVGTALP